MMTTSPTRNATLTATERKDDHQKCHHAHHCCQGGTFNLPMNSETNEGKAHTSLIMPYKLSYECLKTCCCFCKAMHTVLSSEAQKGRFVVSSNQTVENPWAGCPWEIYGRHYILNSHTRKSNYTISSFFLLL